MKKQFIFILLLNIAVGQTDSFWTEVSGDTVTIHHDNTERNCGVLFDFSVTFLDSNIIVITEVDTGDMAFCICEFDLELTIGGLLAGSWTAEIYGQDLDNTGETEYFGSVEFTIDVQGGTGIDVVNEYQSPCNPPSDYLDYFPLQIGNYWEYTNEYFLDSKFRIEVIDTLSINDNLYYKVTNTQSNSSSLLRYDQSGILYSYSISNNIETLSIDFSMNVGDTLTFWYPDSIYFYYLILQSDTSIVPTPISTFNNCLKYLKDDPYVWDDEYWYYYAPNIGNVLIWTWLTQAYWLTAARIDGEELSIQTLIVPKEFGIFDSYPNPFNPTATIRYELPVQSLVSVTIYNLLGRHIKTLINQTQDAGYKSVIWNATNDHGEPVSAGIYLYQIHAGEFVQTKKMVLLK